MATKRIKLQFATSKPFLRYREAGGQWQLSPVFEVESGAGEYIFEAEDAIGCTAKITVQEDDFEFPEGDGSITIQKAIPGATAEDNEQVFQFTVEGESQTFENILVSVNQSYTIENLPYGDYKIIESTPPSGYKMAGTADLDVTLSSGTPSQSVEFTNLIDGDNPPQSGSGQITINKVLTNPEDVHEDKVFKVNVIGELIEYGVEFSVHTPAVLTNLPNGSYTIEEIVVPEGYVNHGVFPAALEIEDGNLEHIVNVINTAGLDPETATGSITIQKNILQDKDGQVINVGDGQVVDTYLAVDADMQHVLTGVSFSLGQADNPQNVFSYQDEAWTQNAVGHGWGSVIEDHEGFLRVYYGLRNINGESERNAPCLSVSKDGGTTFQRVRKNLDPGIIDHPDSNIIFVEAPAGNDRNKLEAFSVYYDRNAPASQRYKCMMMYGGDSSTYVATSEDGYKFTNPIKIFEVDAGDANYSALSYDENSEKWIAIGRGRGSYAGDSDDPPKPFSARRYVIRAESSQWDQGWTVKDQVVIDPVDEWNYGNEADENSFWEEITDNCGSRWVPIGTGKSRPNIYRGTGKEYKGYYIGFFPVYFRHDDRNPYSRPQRTTGAIYPVMAYSKDAGQTWIFPDNTAAAVNLNYYNRVESNPCHTGSGLNEPGQLYSSMLYDRHNGKIFMGVLNRVSTHYEGSVSDYPSESRDIDILSLREDGFGKVHGSGTWQTNLINVHSLATSLKINSKGTVVVEVLDSGGSPITGFTQTDFNTIIGDSVSHDCTWSGDLSTLRGQQVYLKFYMTNAEIFSYSFYTSESKQTDDTFEGKLTGAFTVDNILFSKNVPAVVKKLPLGEYSFQEYDKSGWLVDSIDPNSLTLTSNKKTGSFMATNKYGTLIATLGEGQAYALQKQGTTDLNMISFEFEYDEGTHSITSFSEKLMVNDLGINSSNVDIFDTRIKVLSNGNAVYFNIGTTNGSFLILVDQQMNLLASAQFDNEAIPNNIRDYIFCTDEEDNIYVPRVVQNTNPKAFRIRKYDKNLNFLWESDSITAGERIVVGVHLNNVLVAHTFFTSGLDGNPQKPTGAVFWEPPYLTSLNRDTGAIHQSEIIQADMDPDGHTRYTNYAIQPIEDGRFIVGYGASSDNPDNKQFVIADQYGNVEAAYSHNDFSNLSVWTGSGAGNASFMWANGVHMQWVQPGVVIIDTDDRCLAVNYNTQTLLYCFVLTGSTSRSYSKINKMADGRFLFSRHDNSSFSNNCIIDIDTKEVITIAPSIYSTGQGTQDDHYSMKFDAWELLDLGGGAPPPPTGDATLTIQKQITDGIAADNDVEFTVNITGQANYYNQKVSVNAPLVLQVPYGTYEIEEVNVPANFESTGVTPAKATDIPNIALVEVSESSPTATATFTNKKRDEDPELYARGSFEIVSIENISGAKASGSFELQSTGAPGYPGSISINWKGNSVTYAYAATDSLTDVVNAFASTINNDADINLSATVSGNSITVIEKRIGSQYNDAAFITNTSGTHIRSQIGTVVLSGGEDAPLNVITLEYPFSESAGFEFNPFVKVQYAGGDTREAVAQNIVDAINTPPAAPMSSGSIQLTATRSGRVVTVQEKRAGDSYAGNVLGIRTNGQTIGITPSSGRITLAITG